MVHLHGTVLGIPRLPLPVQSLLVPSGACPCRLGLQLRLLAAVLAQHFHDAHLRSKVSWLQSIAKQETVEQLSMATLKVGHGSRTGLEP